MKLKYAVLALLFLGLSSQAYVFLTEPPTVWPDGNIAMDLQFSGPSGGLMDGSPSWKAVAENALATWNPYVATVKFTAFAQTPSSRANGDGTNEVSFASTVYGQAFGSGVLAVTTRWTVGTRRTEADTLFNLALPWNSYRGSLLPTTSGGTLFDFQRVAIHEFGHTLGLDHPDQHGQNVIAIMNSQISNLDTVAADDIAGVEALYPGVPPQISVQPVSQTVTAGDSVTLQVAAYGVPSPSYQWYFNGLPIQNAISPSILISGVKSGNAGDYTVLVSNSHGSVLSQPAILTVIAIPPSIIAQPANKTVAMGSSASFAVAATGPSLTYQWKFNGSTIPGGTDPILTIPDAQSSNAGNYRAFVTNPSGTATSAVVTLTVVLSPSITLQPQSQTVIVGRNAAFSVSATSNGLLSYQWYRDGAVLAGDTSTNLTLTNVQPSAAGDYTVTVSNIAGSINSAVATLNVLYGPSIASQPQSQTANVGANASFSVSASGNPLPAYFWRFNGATIPNATSNTLTLSNVQPAKAGIYSVLVANSVGSVTSQVAVLTVNRLPIVALVNPTNSATFSAPAKITLSASASDPDGTVSKVDFYWGTSLIGSAQSSPYTFIWTNVPAGIYNLIAQATDNREGSTISTAVNVTVSPTLLVNVLSGDPLTNGLVAFYPFNGNLNDASGNANNGTAFGQDWSFGSDRFGQQAALYLNMTSNPTWNSDGSYVSMPRNQSLDFNQDFTLSLWINLSSGSPPGYVHNLISDGPDYASANWRVISDISTQGGQDLVQFVWNSGSSGGASFFVPPESGTWSQLAIVNSSGTLSLYQDGLFLSSSPATSISNSPVIWLGRHICPGYPTTCPGSYPLVGGIDDLRMYNRALGPQDVFHLFEHEQNVQPGSQIRTVMLSFAVSPGATIQFESSPDLRTWAAYGPLIVSTTGIVYQDADLSGVRQYFRVKLVAP